MSCDRANSNVVTKQNKFNIIMFFFFQARGSCQGGRRGMREVVVVAAEIKTGRKEGGKKGAKENFHHVLLHLSTPHFSKYNFL